MQPQGKMEYMTGEAIVRVLEERGIRFLRFVHPAVFTIEQARELVINREVMQVKNLFLRNRKGNRYYLLVAVETRTFELRDVACAFGEISLSLASKERLWSKLEVEPGAVGPFGLFNDHDHSVVLVLDASLKRANQVGMHPNVNTETLVISIDDLVRLVQGLGNDIRWYDFTNQVFI
jgi:Ala-tRNA(Pro) deacylase